MMLPSAETILTRRPIRHFSPVKFSARGFKSVYSRFISLGVSFALMTFFTFEKVTFWVDRCLSKNVTSFVFKSLDPWHQI